MIFLYYLYTIWYFDPVIMEYYNDVVGELFLKQRLDYETDKAFLVPIIAYDSSPTPHTSQAIINVTVSDENDNFPQITVTTVTPRAQVGK